MAPFQTHLLGSTEKERKEVNFTNTTNKKDYFNFEIYNLMIRYWICFS